MDHSEPSPQKPQVVVIDDEPAFLQVLVRLLSGAGCEVVAAGEPIEGLAAALEGEVEVVVSDIQMPNLSGMDLLREIKAKRPNIEVILVTGQGSVDAAVAAVKAGAYDYLTKPIEHERVVLTVQKAVERKRFRERTQALESMLEVKEQFEDLVGQSQKMTEVFKMIDAVASSSATILIQGESGTGKELVARAIHRRSPRKGKTFVAVNCSALTETLLESELFGHVKGAFTGACGSKRCLFEAADGGTLFLDEIGDIPPSTQVRLLRALQEGEIKRVGAHDVVHVDVRVLAATNVNLAKAVAEGRFREDLFYRLNVIAIELPPLRDRPEDTVPLAYHFLKKFAAKSGKDLTGIDAELKAALTTYSWPGNVRELENAIERAVILSRGSVIGLADAPASIGKTVGGEDVEASSLVHLPMAEAKKLAVGAFERRYLAAVLRRSQGSVSAASRAAGIDRSNFRRLLKQYGMATRSEPDDANGPAVEEP
jgi:DNA-binding NtrC family response regulator